MKVPYFWVLKYLLQIKDGASPGQAFILIQKEGYSKTQRALNLQIEQVRTLEEEIPPSKKLGLVPKLNDAQMDQICEWVYDKNDQNDDFGRLKVKQYIQDTWGIQLTERTAGNIMNRLGFTLKTCQVKTGGQKLSRAALEDIYYSWVVEQRTADSWSIPLRRIRSIDVVYTRRPARKTVTYSPNGGRKQTSKTKPYAYSNALYAMISADGIDHTPSMMVTHDPNMTLDQKDTPNGRARAAYFKACCEEFDIDPARVVYIKSGRKWASECPEHYERFLSSHSTKALPKDSLIMHDGEGAFKRSKVSIFPALGFPNHLTYPAAVHQWLSPNDNNLHGVKAAWSEDYPKFGCGVKSSLALMHLIDLAIPKHVKYYFLRNMIDVKRSDLEHVMSC